MQVNNPDLQAALAYFDAWNRHSTAAIRATFTDNGTYQDPLTGQPQSIDRMLASFENLMVQFPTLRFELGVVSGSDTQASVEWKLTGSGATESGQSKTIHQSGVDVFRIQDGKIASVRGYFDLKELEAQIS